MKLTLPVTGVLALATLFAGCKPKETKPDAAALVPVTERSAHFAAVNQHLELGGTLYGYADIDGDILSVAPYLRTVGDAIAEQQPMAAPFLKQDFAKLITELGLNDVRAIGLSSVKSAGGGFRNNVYLHTPDGRRGLLSVLGGPPTAFTNARLAPADADLYAEADIDATALYQSLHAIVARVAGASVADLLETQLKKDQSGLGLTPYALIQSLHGRATVVLRTDTERSITLPGGAQPFTIPAFQFLVRMDGLAGPLAPALAKVPLFTVSQDGPVTYYTLKTDTGIEGLKLTLAVEGAAIYVASDAAFLKASLARTDGLSELPTFRAALAELGDKGNGITYVNPRLFDQLRRLKTLNPEMSPEVARGVDFFLGNLPSPTEPLVSVRINLPEGILFRSRWHRSLKQDLAMVGVYNPVSIGLLAAMAIPAFEKVRSASQEKAIINNLRQFDGAAQQHMLETGQLSASYAQLVGLDKAIRELKPVAGEDYTGLVVTDKTTELSVVTTAGKQIHYSTR